MLGRRGGGRAGTSSRDHLWKRALLSRRCTESAGSTTGEPPPSSVRHCGASLRARPSAPASWAGPAPSPRATTRSQSLASRARSLPRGQCGHRMNGTLSGDCRRLFLDRYSGTVPLECTLKYPLSGVRLPIAESTVQCSLFSVTPFSTALFVFRVFPPGVPGFSVLRRLMSVSRRRPRHQIVQLHSYRYSTQY